MEAINTVSNVLTHYTTSIQYHLNNWYRKILINILKSGPIPKHLAFIMDGNRRYARKGNLATEVGHRSGGETLKNTLKWCLELGIKEITVFAFSIENFKRDNHEVDSLMAIAEEKLNELISQAEFENEHSIRFFGDIDLLPPSLKKLMKNAEESTKNNPGAVLNVCVSYTSTYEITRAIRTIVENVENGNINECDIDKDLITKYLYTKDSLELDAVIRTSGEYRMSDFLLWQSSFSNIYFVDVLWPEFSINDLYNIIIQYQQDKNKKK